MRRLLCFSLFALVFSGCSLGQWDEDYAYEEAGFAYDSLAVERSVSSAVAMEVSEVTEQKVIESVNLSLHVEDVQQVSQDIQVQVEEWGGSVASSSVFRGDAAYTAYLSVRVPNEILDTAVGVFKQMAVYVASEYSYADDVTESYLDVEARLNNYRAEEEQYLAIMDEASTVEEVLQVTEALSYVRYQIESLESQLNYYDTRVDYSTITIDLSEDERLGSLTEKWRPIGTLKDAFGDWVVFLQRIVDGLLYLLIFGWPVGLALAAWWGWKRKSSKK